VSLGRTDPSRFDGTDSSSVEMTPEEEAALRAQMDRVEEEKRLARLDPGPTWREWFLFDASKWWVVLFLLVADSWIVVGWLPTGNIVGMVLSLAAAVYAEYLLGQFLWHRPAPRPTRAAGGFRPTWYHPFPYGRWTPEGLEAKTTGAPVVTDGTPDPKEFL